MCRMTEDVAGYGVPPVQAARMLHWRLQLPFSGFVMALALDYVNAGMAEVEVLQDSGRA